VNDLCFISLGLPDRVVRVAHGVDLVDVIKMTQTTLTVYIKNYFSVDLRENPMFMRVKQWSFLCDQHEFGEELSLGTAMDLAVTDPAIDHGVPLGLTDPQFGVERDHLDLDQRFEFVEETHR
jgi:hypothetical protein